MHTAGWTNYITMADNGRYDKQQQQQQQPKLQEERQPLTVEHAAETHL